MTKERIYWQDANTRRYYTAVREGACDFEKCGAACCTAFVLEPTFNAEKEYYWDVTRRATIIDIEGQHYAVALHRCDKLMEDNTCSIYPRRPRACVQWPWPFDVLHKALKDICGYSFSDIKRVNKKDVPEEFRK